ncbi:7 transmembrane receptor (rhodopsin family) domain-containing protein [Ditylenchus destructor]|nr:7 transmembrane receptor (rhodopsin family) domain-containing protein [Ditylenchus destructor]
MHFNCTKLYNCAVIFAIFATVSCFEFCDNSTSDQNGQNWALESNNNTLVFDCYGVLSEDDREKIDFQLRALEQQTKILQSDDVCEQSGIKAAVVITNSSPTNVASAFYENVVLNPVCRKSFVLVYSFVEGQYSWIVGPDSPISVDQIRRVFDEQPWQGIPKHLIGSFISNEVIPKIRIGAFAMKIFVERWNAWFLVFFRIVVVIGFFGNIICVLTLIYTKLLKSSINKYLFVLLISDTLFNLWILGKIPREKIEAWNFWGCAFVQYMFSSTMCASCNVLVLLTLERFFAIVFPFRHMQYVHVNRWTVVFIGLLPMQLWILYFHLLPYIDPNSYTIFVNGKCMSQGILELRMITIPFYLSLLILPLFAIISVNFAIAIKLGVQASTNSAIANNETLWILPTIYAILSIPNIVLFVIKTFLPTYWNSTTAVVHDFLMHLNMLDFVYNWFFYAMTSSNFRKSFTSFWSRIFRKARHAPENKTNSTSVAVSTSTQCSNIKEDEDSL